MGGGFIGIGKAKLCGVPGADGAGEATVCEVLSAKDVLGARSGGAGLLEDIRRRAGRSILLIL